MNHGRGDEKSSPEHRHLSGATFFAYLQRNSGRQIPAGAISTYRNSSRVPAYLCGVVVPSFVTHID
jgi:hypothetical protein